MFLNCNAQLTVTVDDVFCIHIAIDLIDEACAKLKNELTSKPTIIDEVDRRIIQLEMERLSIKSDVEKSQNEANEADLQRLQNLESTLLQLYEQQADLNARWQAEREAVLGTNELQEKIAEVQLEIEKAEREYDLNKAAELKYGTLPQLEQQLERAKSKEADETSSTQDGMKPRMLRDEVVPEDIASVISGESSKGYFLRPHYVRLTVSNLRTYFQLSLDGNPISQIIRQRERPNPYHGRQVARTCRRTR